MFLFDVIREVDDFFSNTLFLQSSQSLSIEAVLNIIDAIRGDLT